MIAKVVIINGKPGVGKDEFVSQFANVASCRGVRISNFSTVDAVKRAAVELGWDGTKTKEWRSILCDIKRTWVENVDGSYNDMVEQLDGSDTGTHPAVVFIHCREPEEIKRFVCDLPYPTTTLLITRNTSAEADNSADNNTDNFDYEHIFHNPDDVRWKEIMAEFASSLLDKCVECANCVKADVCWWKNKEHPNGLTGHTCEGRNFVRKP